MNRLFPERPAYFRVCLRKSASDHRPDVINEFLLSAVAPEVNPDCLRKLAQGIDWSAVIASAEHHGLALHLYWQLKQLRMDLVPPDAVRRLETTYRACVIRSLSMASELQKALETLQRESIQAIAFKGPTLAIMAYGDIGCRDFSDLDIFVSRNNVKRATTVLAESGYDYTYGRKAISMAGSNAVDLNNGNCAIDLHWEFIPKYLGHFEPDLKRTRIVSIVGFKAQTLGPEDLLVYLAADYAREEWKCIYRIKDVAHLIARQPMDWDEVWRCAEDSQLCRRVSLALLLAAWMLRAPVPQEVLKRCKRDSKVVVYAENVQSDLLQGILRVDEPLFHLGLMDSWQARLRYCLRRTFEPNQNDLSFMTLPPWLQGLYFVVRPLRIAWVGIKRSLRIADRH